MTDAISIDRLLDEVRPALIGRHLTRPRAFGAHGVRFEVSGRERMHLCLDASRELAGLYFVTRAEMARLDELPQGQPSGSGRQALLLLRKHADGVRVGALRRVSGERTLVIDCGPAFLALRVGGRAPALSASLAGTVLAGMNDGPAALPLPEERPDREIANWTEDQLEEAKALAGSSGRSLASALQKLCPPLGPELARELAASGSLTALREKLEHPRPTLHLPEPLEMCSDRALAQARAVLFAPIPLSHHGAQVVQLESWREATALLLWLRRRGLAFDARLRAMQLSQRRDAERLSQLEAHLERDQTRLEDAEEMRRRAVALLASVRSVPERASEAVVPDPYEAGQSLRIPLEATLSAAGNADRLFEKARRVERARVQIEARLEQTRRASASAREQQKGLAAAAFLSDLGADSPPRAPKGAAKKPRVPPPSAGKRNAGPRRYLTSRGLVLLVGRSARENHELTFKLAAPEDVWLHARDVPGAHVILRDNEGRAGSEDLREAAEVAAFHSEASAERTVDVHVTRRKHVHPARGGQGRVHVAHSETLRVTPCDPEGRLRRR